MMLNNSEKKTVTLGRRVLKSTALFTISTYAVFFITAFRSIILARLLIPEYFGVIALATFFLHFFSQFKNFGLDYALIHKQDNQEAAYSNHFVLQIILGLANVIIVCAAAPILSKFYDPKIVNILIIFVVFSVMQAMSSTPRVFLEKQLLFGRITVFNIVNALIRTVVPIVMALKGFGLWSLVWLSILDMVIPFVGYWLISPLKINLKIDRKVIKWFFQFGFYLWLGGFAMMFMFDFDKFLVGSLVGIVGLGFYSKAFEFTRMPVQMIGHVLSKITLPAYSKLQKNMRSLSLAFSMVVSFNFRVTIICAGLMALAAPEFIRIFLGEKWLGMIIILQILTGFTVLRSIYDEAVTLLIAMGKPNIATKIHFVQVLIMVIFGPILAYLFGVKGMAMAINIMLLIGTIIIYYRIKRDLSISYKNIFIAPLASVCLAGMGVVLFMPYLLKATLLARLIIKLILGTGFYLVFLCILERKGLIEKINFIKALWRGKGDFIENSSSGF